MCWAVKGREVQRFVCWMVGVSVRCWLVVGWWLWASFRRNIRERFEKAGFPSVGFIFGPKSEPHLQEALISVEARKVKRRTLLGRRIFGEKLKKKVPQVGFLSVQSWKRRVSWHDFFLSRPCSHPAAPPTHQNPTPQPHHNHTATTTQRRIALW